MRCVVWLVRDTIDETQFVISSSKEFPPCSVINTIDLGAAPNLGKMFRGRGGRGKKHKVRPAGGASGRRAPLAYVVRARCAKTAQSHLSAGIHHPFFGRAHRGAGSHF